MDAQSTVVLFITSDQVLAAAYRVRLELDDYDITWADPTNAIERLHTTRPDLIYLDIDSAGGGPPLLEYLRACPSTSKEPVIVITRRSEEAIRRSLPPSVDPIFVVSLPHPAGADP